MALEYMVLNEMLLDNRRLGEYKGRVAMVRNFRGRFDSQALTEIAYNDPELLASILDTIDAHPDWDDEQVAENVYFE